jgi:hypothetical protein
MSAENPAQPWRIKPVLPVAKLVGAVALPVLMLAFSQRDGVRWFIAGAAALGLAGWAVRDLIVPVRLAADPDGVTVVVGFARRRRLLWSQIDRVRLDRRQRRGRSAELLEIDVDDSLYLFSEHDLGAAPEDVLAQLEQLRSRARSTPPQ